MSPAATVVVGQTRLCQQARSQHWGYGGEVRRYLLLLPQPRAQHQVEMSLHKPTGLSRVSSPGPWLCLLSAEWGY